jgi:hypothetical protein
MSRLFTLLNRLHGANLRTAFPLVPDRPLEAWPEPTPTRVTVRGLKTFDGFEIRPTPDQLCRAANLSDMRPVIVDNDNQVLLGQLRVEAIRNQFGSLSGVDILRYEHLTETQVVALIRDIVSLIYRKHKWDFQMLTIDCQRLSALVSKTRATARRRALTQAPTHRRASLTAR